MRATSGTEFLAEHRIVGPMASNNPNQLLLHGDVDVGNRRSVILEVGCERLGCEGRLGDLVSASAMRSARSRSSTPCRITPKASTDDMHFINHA
jgi:hypothetical protein